MSSDSDTSSETSPTVRRWNKIEQELNNTKATTRDEVRQKLRQMMVIKQTRRLSRYGQNVKLENMKQALIN